MNELNFSEEDKQKTVEFLNMVAVHSKFNMDTKELIQYFKLLSFMQGVLLKKIDANILEIKRIVEAKSPPAEAAPAPAETPQS